MLSKKLSRLINKLALVAIIFASIAPSISHAIAAQTGASFVQEICSSNGKKITIQVLTTKGLQLATQLVTKDIGAKPADRTTPAGIEHHLPHCPFCANPSAVVAIHAPHAPIVALLAAQTEKQAAIAPAVFASFSSLPPPSQAPPSL